MPDENVALESLSDEAFMDAVEADDIIPAATDANENADSDGEENVDANEDADANENADDGDGEDNDNEEPDADSDEDDAGDNGDTHDDDHSDNDDDGSDGDEEDGDGDADEDTEDPDGDSETEDANDDDLKARYKEIFAPFTANGKEMKVESVEDVRNLMRMGAGFHRKMHILKPHLKVIKSLKDNDLLDDEKINHLIDLSKKKPEAIAKLIKDAGIDPLDINTKGGDEYKPTDYSVSDSAFNLDQAIEGIKDNESFNKSMEVMGEQWDEGSREIIKENPEIVSIVDEHIQNGVFDVVQEFVLQEKTLGRMKGLSDVEAYRVGLQQLHENGKVVGQEIQKEKPKPNPLKKIAKNNKQAERRKKRKAAAAPNKGKPPSKKQDVDLADLDDEAFMKAVS